MALIEQFESLDAQYKDCLVDAAFADKECVWKRVCSLYFEGIPSVEQGVLQKHILEHYSVEA